VRSLLPQEYRQLWRIDRDICRVVSVFCHHLFPTVLIGECLTRGTPRFYIQNEVRPEVPPLNGDADLAVLVT
jgi:hypothetical protein